jgi:hypothetical protein
LPIAEWSWWWPLLGAHILVLVLLIRYRLKHPGSPTNSMTEEEREDWMDDLLFPPYCCWGDPGSNDDDSED